jgi:hypothetical protein
MVLLVLNLLFVFIQNNIRENKDLLLRYLCIALPYEVKGRVYAEITNGQYDMNGDMIFFDSPFDVILDGINVSTEEIHVVAIGNEDTVEFIEIQQTDGIPYTIKDIKPYLRPMSSMTEEEDKKYGLLCFDVSYYDKDTPKCSFKLIKWLLEKHFDFMSLILMGLAIEVTEENNLYK